MREDDADDLVEVLAVRVPELEDDVVLATTEESLGLAVGRHEAGEGEPLVALEASAVTVDHVVEAGEGGLECGALGGAKTLEGRVDELAEAKRGELGRGVGVSGIDGGANRRLEAGGDTAGEGGEDGIGLAVGKLGVAEDDDELLEGRVHDGLVIVTSEDVEEDGLEVGEALVSLATDDVGKAEGRELAVEGLGVVNAAGVVEREDTEDVSSLEGHSRLLDELGDTILRGNERHDHL